MAADHIHSGASKEEFLQEKLFEIFHPIASEMQNKHKENGYRFAHYSSAENGLNIVKSKQIWMRNTSCMSDYGEVLHGQYLIREFFNNKNDEKTFLATLDQCSEGAAVEALTRFYNWCDVESYNTFITCLTEHSGENGHSCEQENRPEHEDNYGRLSMWRAFGSGPSVAIIFDGNKFGNVSGVGFSPVAYYEPNDVRDAMFRIQENVESNLGFLKTLPKATIVERIFRALYYGALCLKHPAFREEREWRIIYTPGHMQPPLIEYEVKSMHGVPQTIYKFPIDLPKWLDRVLIGPTQYPASIAGAFAMELQNVGVAGAHKKIHPTKIPIRTYA